MQVEPEGTVWTNPYQTCTELNLLSKAIDELLHSKTGPMNSLDREETVHDKGHGNGKSSADAVSQPKKKKKLAGARIARAACQSRRRPSSYHMPTILSVNARRRLALYLPLPYLLTRHRLLSPFPSSSSSRFH